LVDFEQKLGVWTRDHVWTGDLSQQVDGRSHPAIVQDLRPWCCGGRRVWNATHGLLRKHGKASFPSGVQEGNGGGKPGTHDLIPISCISGLGGGVVKDGTHIP
jgi:hypothetical protein